MQVGHIYKVFLLAGLLKKFYRRGDIDTTQQLKKVVNNSSQTNNALTYSWEWREWDKILDT